VNEPVLVIIKPDGFTRGHVGDIFKKFSEAQLDIIALRLKKVTKKLAEEHYKHLREKPFFRNLISYLSGEFHDYHKVILIIYCGENAIKKCRTIAGATNPREASAVSIRGAYGRISKIGTFENVVHVSSDKDEAQREIMLWLEPDDILLNLYSHRTVVKQQFRKRTWK